MHRIYSGAIATIAAAYGSDADSGLPGIRKGTRDSVMAVEKVQELFLGPRHRLFADAVDASPWNARGWTYQERLLSQRVLFFAKEQMFFKCRHIEDPLSEDTVSWGAKRIDTVRPSNDSGRDLVAREQSINLVSYEQSVEAYTKRNLTHPDDILLAFSGASHHLDLTFRGASLYGLPLQEIVHALLWFPGGDFPCRVSQKPGVFFPSWSWCGWIGKVIYQPTCRDVLARIVFLDAKDNLVTEDDLRRPIASDRDVDRADSEPWWHASWTQKIGDDHRTYYFETDNPNVWFSHPVAPMNCRAPQPSLVSEGPGGKPLLRFWAETADLDFSNYVPPATIDDPHWWFSLVGKDGLGDIGGFMWIPSQFLRELKTMKLELVRIARVRGTSEAKANGWAQKLKEDTRVACLRVPTAGEELSSFRDATDTTMTRGAFLDLPAHDPGIRGFDGQKFDLTKPYCLNQLLIVEWLPDGTARRIGTATVHIDFWAQEEPVDKLIALC